MILKWAILTVYFISVNSDDKNLTMLLKTSSFSLNKYQQYQDVVIMRFEIPDKTIFASFKFYAYELDLSIYGCTPRDITVSLKEGGLPVINPDHSKFPNSFKNISRPGLNQLEFKSDKIARHINITSPKIGSFNAAAFLSYSDPRNNAIKQQGLAQKCVASLEATLFVETVPEILIALEDARNVFYRETNKSTYYKLYVPENVVRTRLIIKSINFADPSNQLIIRVKNESIPTPNHSIATITVKPDDTLPYYFKFPDKENVWYYFEFYFSGATVQKKNNSLDFEIKFLHAEFLNSSITELSENATLNKGVVTKLYDEQAIVDVMPYQQWHLIREASTESFLFSYVLEPELEFNTAIPIKINSSQFVVLKFPIHDLTEMGGTLRYTLAFKKRVTKHGSTKTIEPEPEGHIVIGCINRGVKQVPVWPNKCVGVDGIVNDAPISLNKTRTNSSMQIPFPEVGMWYATFKLFCGDCRPCACSEQCKESFQKCVDNCEMICVDDVCYNCTATCKQAHMARSDCKNCNCNGNCMSEEQICTSRVFFDVSSQPCVNGNCGKNGFCYLRESDGILFSTCVCVNSYRGWGCTDDSFANPFWKVVLGLVLLVLSNLAFLPAVYVAYKRKYYVEAVCYFAICFFSTFYHACDAGEHLINFCITTPNALQFADFCCALLAIWVTLVAVADLPHFWPSLCHITGAIILSFCTTINKTALWIFLLPTIGGGILIFGSWYMKYRKVKQWFVKKRFVYVNLPCGGSLAVVGLVIYSLLETEANYMYLHSMWHIIMALTVLIILPDRDTFTPDIIL